MIFSSYRSHRTTKILMIGSVFAFLTGCGGFSLNDYNPFFEKEKPLPGERIALLTEADPLTVATEVSGQAVTIPPQTSNTDWAQPGGAASNFNGNIALASGVNRAWRTNIGRGSNSDARLAITPIIAAGRVYAIDIRGNVSAYSIGSGGRIWSISIVPEGEDDDGVIGGGLSYSNGLLFVATGYGELMALNPGSGQKIWSVKLGIPARSAPTSSGNSIFLVTADNIVHSYSQVDGTEEWDYRGIPETTGLLANASPAVGEGKVIVPYSSGEIIAFDQSSGSPVWADTLTRTRRATSLSGINEVAAKPVINSGVVFAVSVSGRMVASNVRDGERIWSRNISSSHTPAVAGNSVYVLSTDNRLVALSRTDGKVRWIVQLPNGEDNDQSWAGPLLAGSRLWVTSSEGDLRSFNPVTGEGANAIDLKDDVFLPPIAASGKLLVLTDDAELIAFN